MSAPKLICPSCSSRLERPASLRDGDQFDCPKCAATFRAGGAGQITARKPERPEVEEVEVIDEEVIDEVEVLEVDEAWPRKRRMKESQRMKLAYWGLGLQYAKFLGVLASMLIAGLYAITRAFGWGDFLNVFVGSLSTLLSAGTSLVGLTGALLCFWVPKRSQARLLIQIAFGLDVGAILAHGLGTILLLMGGRMALAGLSLSGMGTFASLGACVLFLLFLRAFAFYLRDRGTESEAMEIMVRWIVMTVLAPLAVSPLGALVAVSGKSILGAICALIAFGALALTFLIYYFKVLMRLLNLIAALRQRIVSRYDFD